MYCSPFSGDLLVGMNRAIDIYSQIGKVLRYNKNGEHTQTIQGNIPQILYNSPCYITENNNGDVVVSDLILGAVVVTSREGNHRFSYEGPLFGYRLKPRGVCTDALSHILVCDFTSYTVQLLSQDGEFLKYLLTKQTLGIDDYFLESLSYDFHTHCLWVGTWRSASKVSVYRYINRHPFNEGTSKFISGIIVTG